MLTTTVLSVLLATLVSEPPDGCWPDPDWRDAAVVDAALSQYTSTTMSRSDFLSFVDAALRFAERSPVDAAPIVRAFGLLGTARLVNDNRICFDVATNDSVCRSRAFSSLIAPDDRCVTRLVTLAQNKQLPPAVRVAAFQLIATLETGGTPHLRLGFELCEQLDPRACEPLLDSIQALAQSAPPSMVLEQHDWAHSAPRAWLSAVIAIGPRGADYLHKIVEQEDHLLPGHAAQYALAVAAVRGDDQRTEGVFRRLLASRSDQHRYAALLGMRQSSARVVQSMASDIEQLLVDDSERHLWTAAQHVSAALAQLSPACARALLIRSADLEYAPDIRESATFALHSIASNNGTAIGRVFVEVARDPTLPESLRLVALRRLCWIRSSEFNDELKRLREDRSITPAMVDAIDHLLARH